MKTQVKKKLDILIDIYNQNKNSEKVRQEISLTLKNFVGEVDSEIEKELFRELISKYWDVTNNLNETLVEVTKLSQTDNLTKLKNRTHFNERFREELIRVKRYEKDLSFIIFDIDKFKSINDTYGHNVGDLVLVELSRLIEENLRKRDILARWGGEEFVILLPETKVEVALEEAEKLRVKVASFEFSVVVNVTCSFGVTKYTLGDTEEAILKRGDEALYKAKNEGRNRVNLL